ncbi:MAG: glycine cleavage system protein R [Gammaproteobacteria bacterium]|nr:glycine cleavage system protein R [Gammaproteobacteria bacterium]
MIKHLVISALGDDKPGIVKSISKQILDAGGNIADSRMSVLGDEFALIMLVDGAEDAIKKIKSMLPEMEESLSLTIISKETAISAKTVQRVPYVVEVVAMDNPGIVHEVTEFLTDHNINVEELATSSYRAAHTGAAMFSMEMSISIPGDVNISSIKSALLAFCDERNLDVSLSAL